LNVYLSEFEFIRPLTKRQRVLACLAVISKQSRPITRFDVEAIGDHCLNTTISEIGRIDGIKVERRDVKRPTRFGKDTDCKEYWLESKQIGQAENILVNLTLRGVA